MHALSNFSPASCTPLCAARAQPGVHPDAMILHRPPMHEHSLNPPNNCTPLQVDVYSYAMILYQLFEGNMPYAGHDPVDAARQAALMGARPSFMLGSRAATSLTGVRRGAATRMGPVACSTAQLGGVAACYRPRGCENLLAARRASATEMPLRPRPPGLEVSVWATLMVWATSSLQEPRFIIAPCPSPPPPCPHGHLATPFVPLPAPGAAKACRGLLGSGP
jgi:hypothetical protein